MILDYSKYIPKYESNLIENHQSPLFNKINNDFFRDHYEICKYCNQKLITPIQEVPYAGEFGFDKVKIVYECINCGWWYFHHEESMYLGEGVSQSQTDKLYGILTRYSHDSIDVPLNALRSELRRRPDIAFDLNPTKFEILVGDILSDYLSCEVIHVGKTNDGGIDLILIEGNNEKVIVQVKRRTKANSTEGVVPIRELIGVMAINQYPKSMFVTTSKKYSSYAKKSIEQAIANDSVVESIQLIDFPRFIDILNLSADKEVKPWEKITSKF